MISSVSFIQRSFFLMIITDDLLLTIAQFSISVEHLDKMPYKEKIIDNNSSRFLLRLVQIVVGIDFAFLCFEALTIEQPIVLIIY